MSSFKVTSYEVQTGGLSNDVRLMYMQFEAKATRIPKNLSPRLMTMSPLYHCGKPYSRGTHDETAKNVALF